MKYMPILAFFIFFTTVLDASYARSIRVGSFLQESRAERELVELQKFVQSNYRLTELQRKWNYEVKIIHRGKYHLNVIEPLTNKKVVQEILDILRTKYSYVYPKKIKYLSEYANYKQNIEVKKEIKIEKKEIENISVEIDHIELMKKIDEILKDGKIAAEEVNGKAETTEVDNTVHKRQNLPKVELAEEESFLDSINFDIFSSFFESEPSTTEEESSFFDMFSFSDKEEEIKLEKADEKVKNSTDESSVEETLKLIKNYVLEIILFIALLIFMVLIKLYISYKRENENKISMQDIYS